MSDEITLTLNSPITEEQWDIINDVDFDYTDNITFHTKHGKEVEFVKRKWIPCSERLPEVGARVLVSCYGRVCYGKLINTMGNLGNPIFEICDSTSASRPIVLETTVHGEYTKSRISAWMPLPKPYREVEHV